MRSFGHGEYIQPFVKTADDQEKLITELDEPTLITLLESAKGNESIYLAQSILALTAHEFRTIEEKNQVALDLANPWYDEIKLEEHGVTSEEFYRFKLAPFDKAANIKLTHLGKVVAKIHYTGKGHDCVNILGYKPIIIETSSHVENIKVISENKVRLGAVIDAERLFVLAENIDTESHEQTSLLAKQSCLYAYQNCELNGVLESKEGSLIIKAGTVKCEDIDAKLVAIITESGDQNGNIISQTTGYITALNWHEHVDTQFHAPDGIKMIVPKIKSQGTISTNDFSLLHYNGSLEGKRYYFGEKTRIDTNYALEESEGAHIYFNGYFEAISEFSARFAGALSYCPNMSIVGTNIKVGANEPYKPPSESQGNKKRGIHLQAGMNVEISGKMDLKDASLTVQSGYWIKVLAEIQAFSANADSIIHFNGKDVELAKNIASNATVIISGAEQLTLGRTSEIEAKNVYIDAPACDVTISVENRVSFQQQMIVNVHSFDNQGHIKGEEGTIAVEASDRINNDGKINVGTQVYVAPWISSSDGLQYQQLMTSAYASYIGGFNITGTSTHVALLAFSTHINLQGYLSPSGLLGLGVGLVNIGLVGLSFVTPYAIPAQIIFNSLIRGASIVANFSSLVDSAKQVYQFSSTPNKVKFVGRLTQAGIAIAAAGVSVAAAINGLSTSGTVTPEFKVIPFLKTSLPYAIGTLSGSSTYAIISVRLGALLGVSDVTYSVFDFSAGVFVGVSSASTSFFHADKQYNFVLLSNGQVGYFQIIGGDTKSLFGSNNIQANTVVLISPYFEHKNWNVNSPHIIVMGGGGTTTITQSNLNGVVDAQSPLILANQTKVNGQLNDHAAVEIINSEINGTTNLDANVTLQADGGKIKGAALNLGTGAKADLELAQVDVDTTNNNGAISGSHDSFVTKQMNQHGTIDLKDSLLGVGQSSGDMSSAALHMENTILYTPSPDNMYDANQKKLIDDLLDYCSINQRFPTAKQWYSIFNHDPTKEEIEAYNKTLGSTFTSDRNFRALSDIEFDAIQHPNDKTFYGRANPADAREVNDFAKKLLANKNFLPGVVIKPYSASDADLFKFNDSLKDMNIYYNNGELCYYFPTKVNLNKQSYYNLAELGIYAPDIDLSGEFYSLSPAEFHADKDINLNYFTTKSDNRVGLFAGQDMNFNFSDIQSKSNIVAHAGNKLNVFASHLKGSEITLLGVHGVTLDPSVVTVQTGSEHHFQFQGLHSGPQTTRTYETQVDPSKIEGENIYILAPDGLIISHATQYNSTGEIYFNAHGDVLLYDVKGQKVTETERYSLCGYYDSKTINTISTPSEITSKDKVYAHSDTGNIIGEGVKIKVPDAKVYADAPEGDVKFVCPELPNRTETTEYGLLGLTTPFSGSPVKTAMITGTAIMTQSIPASTTVTASIGKLKTETTQDTLGEGGIEAKEVIITAKNAAITNGFGVKTDALHVTADTFDYDGAQLTATEKMQQNSVQLTVDLSTGDVTNGSYTNAHGSAKQVVTVNANTDGIKEVDLNVKTLNIHGANFNPAVLKGHADVVNVESPIDSSSVSSTSTTTSVGLSPSDRVDSGSLAFSHSHAHHESISPASSFKPADASGFTVDTVNATDAEVGSNINPQHINHAQQSLANSSQSISLGASDTPQGICSVQLGYDASHGQDHHSLNMDVPVTAIYAGAAFAVALVKNNNDSDWGYSNDDYRDNGYHDGDYPDDEYYDFENSDTSRQSPVAKHPSAPGNNDNTVTDLKNSMFKDTPSALSRLFPELETDLPQVVPTWKDPAIDMQDKSPYQWKTRGIGALKAIGGLTEASVGAGLDVATFETVVGAFAGSALLTSGIDNFSTGLRQLISGRDENTFFVTSMTKLGISEEASYTLQTSFDWSSPQPAMMSNLINGGYTKLTKWGNNIIPTFNRDIVYMDVNNIRFTQPQISPYFSHNDRLDDLLLGLKWDVLDIQHFKPMQVVKVNENYFSLNNRRLLLFSLFATEKVPVKMVSLEDPYIAWKFNRSYNPIDGEGKWVVVALGQDKAKALETLFENNKINDGPSVKFNKS